MNRKARTLIIDDEPLARSRLRNLLKNAEAIELLDEARNGREAVQMIARYEPDLIFLDIQMPDMDGFDVINELKGTVMPFVIFITAYDQYALKAFDVHAVDYVLKPIDDDRFYASLDHALEQIDRNESAAAQDQILQVLSKFQPAEKQLKGLKVKVDGVEKFIQLKDIDYLESSGNYVLLHLAHGRLMHRATMQQLEDELPKLQFLRIHRSYLVNRFAIRKASYQSNNEYLLTMKNGTQLRSGRNYRGAIEDYLKERSL